MMSRDARTRTQMQRLSAHVARCHRTDAILPSWKPVFLDPRHFFRRPRELSLLPSLAVKFPQDPKEYPFPPCTSEKHYHMLSLSLSVSFFLSFPKRVSFLPQSFGPRNRTRNALTRPPTPAGVPTFRKFPRRSICSDGSVCQISGRVKFER